MIVVNYATIKELVKKRHENLNEQDTFQKTTVQRCFYDAA